MAELVKTVLNGQYEIILPKHRADREEWYTKKGWERARLASMNKHLSHGDVMFYVGSEEGEMPALCQMWGAEVFMIEPNDRVWPNTKAIWDANDLKAPLGCFVGFASNKTSGNGVYFSLGMFPDCANGEVIGDHGFKELVDAGNIPQAKIDDIAQELIRQDRVIPTALSLDVEGSEWEVLQGAESMIRTFKPKIWLSLHPEFLFRMYGKYSYEVRRWLIDLGYTEELLDYQHEAHFFYHV